MHDKEIRLHFSWCALCAEFGVPLIGWLFSDFFEWSIIDSKKMNQYTIYAINSRARLQQHSFYRIALELNALLKSVSVCNGVDLMYQPIDMCMTSQYNFIFGLVCSKQILYIPKIVDNTKTVGNYLSITVQFLWVKPIWLKTHIYHTKYVYHFSSVIIFDCKPQ